MYKVLARSASARKQAARKLVKVEKEKAAKELREALRDRTTFEASRRKVLKDAKQMAEEDWKLGLLAPRRDVGRVANTFGSLDQMDSTPPPALPQYRRWQAAMGKREASGKGWFGNQFYVNDRVVVIEGREKGKIGVISEVNKRNQTVKLKDMNMV
jgi:large subunit ribosomal protein L24